MKEKKVKKTKKSKMHPFIKGFLGCIVVVLVVACGASFVVAGALHGKLNYNEIEEVKREPFKEAGVKNILLIGNDSRSADESGRSDAMILVSISSKTNSIHLTSLLRDIYVDIPGHDGNRLNAAYAYGGPELLMETLEENFDIEVNRYMLVNFQAFANLVDAVGGVDLELSNEEVQYVNGYLVEYNQLEGRPEGTDYLDTSLSGNIHLNGPQALAYCRNRYIGSDFARTERQRKVISAIVKKVAKTSPAKLLKIVNEIMPMVTTNLTRNELVSLGAGAFLKFLRYDIKQHQIPAEGTWSNASVYGEGSVLKMDIEKNAELLDEFLYGKKKK